MDYAFFPGCTISYRLPFIEKSVRLVCDCFNVKLTDLPFSCCPEPNSVRSFSQESWLALAARNIAIAEREKKDIMTACAGCFETLKLAKHELDSSDEKRDRVNEILDKVNYEYKGISEVKHIMEVLYDEIGLEKISERVVRPVNLRVVTHPGCHLLRPEKILQLDNAEDPKKLDELVSVLGIEALQYMDKTMCCGAGIRGSKNEIAYAVLRDKMNSMTMVHPDAIVVFCPTCFLSFEMGQRVVNRMFDTEISLPVYYYTELLAVAMDLPELDPIFSAHRVKGDLLGESVRENKKEKTSPSYS